MVDEPDDDIFSEENDEINSALQQDVELDAFNTFIKNNLRGRKNVLKRSESLKKGNKNAANKNITSKKDTSEGFGKNLSLRATNVLTQKNIVD